STGARSSLHSRSGAWLEAHASHHQPWGGGIAFRLRSRRRCDALRLSRLRPPRASLCLTIARAIRVSVVEGVGGLHHRYIRRTASLRLHPVLPSSALTAAR